MFTFCMQPNTCRSWRRAEEKATRVCGHGRDQEVELMVWAVASRGTVEELAAGGRGSKRRRRKREGLQRGERNRRWLLVVVWWLCWLPVVELMVGRPVMRVVVAEGHGGERKKREDCAETGKAGFLADFGPDFLLL
jgi:hypothetical protein